VNYIDDGDILDLRELVTEILADGEVSLDELRELKELIADVLENNKKGSNTMIINEHCWCRLVRY
jgi:hypothetical protein